MTDRIAEPWGARTPYARARLARAGRRAARARGSGGRRRALGPHRRRCCTRTATASTSPCATAGSPACAGGRPTGSTTAGSTRRTCTAGRPTTPPIGSRARSSARAAGWSRRDWDTAMGRVVERSKELLGEPGGWGRIGFYTTGQLFLEEYYTLAVIGKAGIGTPHMDGNTRLCTATAAAALKACSAATASPAPTPTSTIATRSRSTATTLPRPRRCCGCGCSIAAAAPTRRGFVRRSTRDPGRARGRRPPGAAARHQPRADERAAARAARRGWFDADYVARTRSASRRWSERSPVHAGRVRRSATSEPALREAARDDRHRRAPAVHGAAGLLPVQPGDSRGVRGEQHPPVARDARPPGAGVLQMNGQPTAQNTRETGADGDLPGFRNWENARTCRSSPSCGTSTSGVIPHWAPPTHAMQLWRYAEQGSIELLWISATNPAVSLPDLARIRRILERDELHGGRAGPFLTETAALADVVLPAATWGEKTGSLHQRGPDGAPVRARRRPAGRGARRSRHLPRLRAPDGLPRPRRRAADRMERRGGRVRGLEGVLAGSPVRLLGAQPRAAARRRRDPVALHRRVAGRTERLYVDDVFNTEPDNTETYGQDLITGRRRAPRRVPRQAAGRARIPARGGLPPVARGARAGRSRCAHHRPDDLPVPHAHQDRPGAGAAGRGPGRLGRAQRRRTPRALGVAEGDRVRVRPPRGAVEGPARIGAIRPGVVFVPFHYGYWDAGAGARGAGGQRADDHRLGPGLQAADVQARRGRGGAAADAARPLPRAAARRAGATSRRRSARSATATRDEAGRPAPL